MPRQMANEDRQLFRRLGSNDQQALQQIMDEYSDALSGLITGILKNEEQAREILEDVYLRLWDHRKSVAQMENPGGWLYRTALFHALNTFKKENRNKLISLDDNILASRAANLNHEIDIKETVRQIALAVDKLSPQKKLIFKLSREEGLTRREIAARLDITESTVKNHLTEALKTIREALAKWLTIFIL